MSRSPHDDSDPYGINSQGHTVGLGKSSVVPSETVFCQKCELPLPRPCRYAVCPQGCEKDVCRLAQPTGITCADHECDIATGVRAPQPPSTDKPQPASQFTAMAWGDRITDEQLDELLARAEKCQTVLLRIDQLRDLVRQAKEAIVRSAVAPISSEIKARLIAYANCNRCELTPDDARQIVVALDLGTRSASVSISAHEEALVELNLLRSQTRELAERCRPAVAHDARLRERDVDSDKYAHTYKPVLKAEAERAAKLLDDIDAILGARSVEPHRSGGPIADGTPKPEHASPDRSSAK